MDLVSQSYHHIAIYSRELVFNCRMPLFILLAGYFCGFEITTKKWKHRLIYLGLSLLVWNTIFMVVYERNFSIHGLTGIGGQPYNSSMWFLRDIFIFLLITPLITKFKNHLLYIALVCIIVSKSTHELKTYGIPYPGYFGWYCIGLCLNRWNIKEIKTFVSKGSFVIFFMGILLGISRGYFISNGSRSFQQSGAEEFFGILIITSLAILIEKHLPRIASLITSLTSACFLSFALHIILLDKFGQIISQYISVYLMPFIIFIIIWFLERLIKNFLPYAHPILAHSKYTEDQINKMKKEWRYIKRIFSFSKSSKSA